MSRSSIPGPSGRHSSSGSEDERRSSPRYSVEWAVDCVGKETFLYAEITNISQLGIFVACETPFEVGTLLTLKFAPAQGLEPFCLPGRVQWINRSKTLTPSKHPGMGIRFVDLTLEDRERIVEAIHTIAYLRNYSN